MRLTTVMSAVLLVQCVAGQSTSRTETGAKPPLYQVTIVSRTTKAVNYGYLTAPTRIGFKGTPLLANARGQAVVEAKRGATQIRAQFEDVPPPQRFGAQYLTYVVWAISPDGRAQNIGELSLDGSNKGKLTTSSAFQTFAMIVTAEPYYSVQQPSDAVVMENVITSDTIGKVEEVNATYELMPRKPFTYDASSQPSTAGRMVSKQEYEATTALYQALNAIQIAQSQEADRYAPDQLNRARQLYEKARKYPVSLSNEIVSMAREAAQIAEDSRAIAAKRAEADKAADEQRHLAQAHQAAAIAESERSRTVTVAPPPQPTPEVRPAPPPPAQPAPAASTGAPPIQVDEGKMYRGDPRASENRRRMLASLVRSLDVIDSAKGLVITIPAQMVDSASLSSILAPVATTMRPYRDLHVEVQGHSGVPDPAGVTGREAERVRAALIGAGVSPDIIVARGYGNTHPRTSNASPAGRQQNRRVEIIIAGDAIGTVPTWDRTYSLRPGQVRR